MIAATLNRTLKSFALAIVGAEYVLAWLPRGTHRWDKFLRPDELEAMVTQAHQLTLTSRAFRNDQLALFYDELAAATGAHKILPMNSGARASLHS